MIRDVPRIALALSALLAAATGGGGCGASFDPYERLNSLRVLAIKSEPVAPAPGETTTLSALVYSPWTSDDDPSPQPFTYQWSWCPLPGPANDGYPCLITEKQIVDLGGPELNFSLGAGATAQLTHNLDPALLMTFCQGAPGLPLAPNCQDGFPAQVTLTVRTGDVAVTAVRTLHLRLDNQQPGNNNPVIGKTLHATVKDDQGTPVDTMLDPGGTVTLVRKQNNEIKADVTVDQSESYQGLNDNNVLAPLTERLYISWFVETGDLDHARTSYNQPNGRPFDELLKNKWQPERTKIYARQTAALYAILRDNREGVDWTSAKVTLGDRP
jgi:hypothetical protein